MNRLLALSTLAFLLSAAPVSAPSGMDTARLARIPVRMKSLVDSGQIAGAVDLIARNGTIVFHEAVGFQDLESRKPMRKDSIFQIMSMTKPVTGVAIMMLMEEGKLSINDPVEKYLPEFKDKMVAEKSESGEVKLRRPSRPITIRDLMTHTSGMEAAQGEFKDIMVKMDRKLSEAVAHYAKEPLGFDPGTKWLYSNTGIATLGRLIEVLSDQPYEVFIAERLLKPLGMKDSFFFPPADKIDRIALNYVRKDGNLVRAPVTSLGGDSALYRKGAVYSGPEHGLYSTATDLAAFYQMMANGGTLNGRRYLSPYSVEVMTSVHTGELRAGHLAGTGFGLTWEVVKDPIGTVTLLSPGTFGHGGAFNTHGWVDRKKNLI
ncbi:MAG TPA: serine hydrolase domain-containing protein, partial [Bryobacteraceae bacterium]|nr:serine hydrolase domain-containing protein [Bryobacteraceae bacterium]